MQELFPLLVQSGHFAYQLIQHLDAIALRQVFATPTVAHTVTASGQIGLKLPYRAESVSCGHLLHRAFDWRVKQTARQKAGESGRISRRRAQILSGLMGLIRLVTRRRDSTNDPASGPVAHILQ